MLSQKVRTNASISYFFLGWLFLLAKNNPNFSDPFIKLHAKIATKGHIFFFVVYFFYSYFLSEFLSYSIPIVQLSIDQCVRISFFVLLIFFIIRGVYSGQKNTLEETLQKKDTSFSGVGNSIQFSGASELQRTMFLLAHIPFLGMFISRKYPNKVTISGGRISSIFGFIYISSFIYRGFDSLSMILLFIGIFLIVFLASRFFLNNTYTISPLLEKIPDVNYIYEIIRTFPLYVIEICGVIFGKKDVLSFSKIQVEVHKKDVNFQTSLQEHFTDKSLSFPSFWIYIPLVNIIFLPKLFLSRTTQFVIAIGQGLVITLLFILIGIFYSFTSSFLLFLIFPVIYGITSLYAHPFTRIPLIYEIYALINTLTFGLLKNTERLKAAQKQDTAVSYDLK